jgi:hypothetical protein
MAPPISPPTAPPARITPQAVAPPSSREATTGPSTWNAASDAFESANVAMEARTQRREATSRHPSARSARNGRRSAAARGGIRIARRKPALTRKLAPSTANAQPAPAVATSSPATSGPKMCAALCEMLTSAFACWSRARLTSSGMRPTVAGTKNAEADPITTASPMRCHVSPFPVMSSVETTACAPARTRSQATITRCRGSRSDHTPPASVRSTRGTENAANTMPRSAAVPPTSSTAKASATPTSASPIADPVWPSQSIRNGRSESASVELRRKAQVRSIPRGAYSLRQAPTAR